MRVIVHGRARGRVLRSAEPINFLGAVDKQTGIVGNEGHPLYQMQVGKRVLVFPHGVGSSVGAYTVYSLAANGVAPAAMICKRADLTVATGCALANIPLVLAGDAEFASLRDGMDVAVDTKKADMIRQL